MPQHPLRDARLDAAARHDLKRVVIRHGEAAVAGGPALERGLPARVLARRRQKVLRRRLLRIGVTQVWDLLCSARGRGLVALRVLRRLPPRHDTPCEGVGEGAWRQCNMP